MVKPEMKNQVNEVVVRIRDMQDIKGYTDEELAAKAEVDMEHFKAYMNGEAELPFTFVHKCALAFGLEMTELIEGQSARLSSYNVVRGGMGLTTANEAGELIQNLAPYFKKKLAEPYLVTYDYDEKLQNLPIHTTIHAGQEFDYVVEGSLKVQVGEHVEILNAGDSIYYTSGKPHGMIAVGGKACKFIAMIMASDEEDNGFATQAIVRAKQTKGLVYENFIDSVDNEDGSFHSINFKNTDKFNFAFDIVDEIAKTKPDKLAMIHLDKDKNERRFTFKEFKELSNQAANYFTSLGIKKGDRVMLVLKRHYQFWVAFLALNKIGAVVVPATNQLKSHDFVYRFQAGDIHSIVCTFSDGTTDAVDEAAKECPFLQNRIIVGGHKEGWRNFDDEYVFFSRRYLRTADSAKGEDPMIMLFSSGTNGYPKMVLHSCTYALGHFITAKYWHCVRTKGLHFTISDTGWGKSLWGKLFGQWLNEAAVFVYDFERFHADDILQLFGKYPITTFCAPPTMYRMFIKEDLSKYDLSCIEHATTAGEALNPEVFYQFKQATGLDIMEGFGQTETTLTIGNLVGMKPKPGSMGKPSPAYDVQLLDTDGNPVGTAENGEICISTKNGIPCGLLLEYYKEPDKTKEAWHDGYYHTGDIAYKDEDGYFWYVSRIDDVIKSSGYRIGPFEIENVIMELPYVLECGVCAAPDPIRGQVVKACIVLVNGKEGTEELKKEIQNYVKEKTAPYKYPRIVEFRTELPKTISGKVIRKAL
ncbi:MAG: AMP-binding protein [Lachnospiraceae bacterium]|nr:AMP-binding protein [Lachnospiraceae bacterium]